MKGSPVNAKGLFIFFCFLIGSAAACEAPHTTIRTVSNEGLLRLVVRPDEAHVYVDNADKGEVSQYENEETPLLIQSGTRIIEIKQEGYQSFRREMYIGGGAFYEIMVTLEEQQ